MVRIQNDPLTILFEAMATQEGYFQTPFGSNPAQRNNNPLNLNYAHQDGAVPGNPTRFACFPSVGAGIAAGMRQLAAWIQRGLSLEQIIWTQAPPTENNTGGYLMNVLDHVRQFYPDYNPLDAYKNLYLRTLSDSGAWGSASKLVSEAGQPKSTPHAG